MAANRVKLARLAVTGPAACRLSRHEERSGGAIGDRPLTSTGATSPRPHARKLSASQFAVSYEPAAADTTAANFWGSSTPTKAARFG